MMTINGKTLKDLGIIPLKGAEDNLFGKIERKELVYNDNRMMDGSRAVTVNRKVKRRENISVPFHIVAVSRTECLRKLEQLDAMLGDGVDGSGINEVVLLEQKLRLVYTGFSTLKMWKRGRATVNFIFTELNPRDRAL